MGFDQATKPARRIDLLDMPVVGAAAPAQNRDLRLAASQGRILRAEFDRIAFVQNLYIGRTLSHPHRLSRNGTDKAPVSPQI